MPSRLRDLSTHAKSARSYVITSAMVGRGTPCAPFPCFNYDQEHEHEQEERKVLSHPHDLIAAIDIDDLTGYRCSAVAGEENSRRT